MQIIEMATKAYEQLEEEGITEEDLAREDREAVKNQRVLRDETFRLIDIVKEGKDTDRVNALLVLEKLGPLAKTEAMHILRHGALHDPDENIRSQMVRTIAAIETNQPSLMSELRKLLRDGSPSVRWEVLHVLKGTKPAPKEMLSELWPLSTDPDLGSEVLEAIASIQDDKPHFISEVLDRLQRGDFRDRQTRMVIGRHFLEEDEAISMAWDESRENKTQILEMVLEMLTAEDALERKEASDWLIKRENEIPGELLDSVVRELKQQSRTRDDWAVDSEVLNLTERLMERKRAERNLLLRDLRDEDSSVQIEAIKRAAETDDEWALRILIQEWVQWIASGQGERIQLVEEAAEKMRHNPLAVLPLVNQLSQEFQPSEQLLRAAPSASETLAQMPAEHAATSEKYSDVEVLRAKVETILKNELDAREWNIHQRILRQLTDRKNIKFDEEAIRKDILALINTEFKERELRVHQRIARQLADMSNPNFFKEGTEAPPYQAMRLSLEDYAVPILARLLPAAADDEIRKNLAYTLGNVGGREAVDALSRAVVGEERTRANRQKLLAEYYLDPSRQRSDEASEILKGAVKEAKRTLWFQQGLNIIVFVAGLGILIGGLLIAIRSQDAATQVAGILAGLGGFGGVIVQLVKNPLDRIQNAMANLVQIETAFTSFIWELNLNGTYIQSQYVAEGILTDDDIAQTISRIENAMNLTMDQVAVYTDRGRQLLVPNITSLSPVIGTSGTTISIFGQNLTRHKNQNQNGGQRLAIAVNHVPVLARDLGKKDSVIDFELPPELPTSLNITDGTIWISLIIDGRETNALPFQLVEK